MTKDDIIRMARAAGFRAGSIELYDSDPMPFVAPASATNCMPELERFAALVAASTREACAAEMDLIAQECYAEDSDYEPFVWAAAAIRALGDA